MMMTVRTGVGAALVAIAGLATSLAPEWVSAQGVRSLSLEEAIWIAKDNNPAFLATTNDADLAKWQVREAYGRFLPSVTAAGGAQYEYAGVQRFGIFSSADIAAGTTDYLLSSYFLSVDWSIDGNALFQARSARANQRATEARGAAAEFALEATVTLQYLAALRARDAIGVAEGQVARWEQNFELVRARVDAGASLSTHGRQAEVDLGRARVALLRAENLYRTEVARLVEQLGTDLGAPVELVSDFAVFEPGWDRAELIEMATSGHPSVRAARASEASASAQVNRARSSYFPTVSVSAVWSGFTRQVGNQDYVVQLAQSSVDRQRQSCQFDNALLAHLPDLPGLAADDCSRYVLTEQMRQQVLAANETFPLHFTRQPLSLRLNVTLPAFQGFAKQRNIAQTQADRRDALHARRAEELRLRTAVAQSYDDLVTAYGALWIEQRNLEVASGQLELVRRRYALGAAPFLELLDAEDSIEQSERDHLATVYDFHGAIWSLEAAVGRRLRPRDG